VAVQQDREAPSSETQARDLHRNPGAIQVAEAGRYSKYQEQVEGLFGRHS
jgi:hypothetical protein